MFNSEKLVFLEKVVINGMPFTNTTSAVKFKNFCRS